MSPATRVHYPTCKQVHAPIGILQHLAMTLCYHNVLYACFCSVGVYAIIIDGSSSTEGITGSIHITCTLDVAEQVGLSEAQLAEIHDYPLAAQAVINYP